MLNALRSAQERVREGLIAYFESGHRGTLDLAPWGADVRLRLSDYARRGKLLRGAMVSLGFSLFSNDSEIHSACIDAGVAMELLQSFLLIHDDIMDQDLLRRGGPSVHAQYIEACPTSTDPVRGELYGLSMGICAGDIAAFCAMEILGSLDVVPERLIPIIQTVSREIATVGLAQMQDVHHGYVREASEDAILQVYTYKTGRYTFSLPLSIGAMIAGADTGQIDILGRLGEAMGRIFQIRDDQLGIFGTTEEIGKPAGSDVREDKKTLFRHYVYSADQTGHFRAMFGSAKITEEDLEKLREYIRSEGILDEVDRRVRKEANQVRTLTGELDLASGGSEAIETLLRYNLSRSV